MKGNAMATSDEERRLKAAADKLYSIGLHYHWWGEHPKPSIDKLDLLRREEFLDVTYEVVKAYNGATSFPRTRTTDTI
jgi:hypothetical protein